MVPVPTDAHSPNFRTNVGTAKYSPESDAIVWSIKQFQGQKEYLMKAQFNLPSVCSDDRDKYMKIPITVNLSSSRIMIQISK